MTTPDFKALQATFDIDISQPYIYAFACLSQPLSHKSHPVGGEVQGQFFLDIYDTEGFKKKYKAEEFELYAEFSGQIQGKEDLIELVLQRKVPKKFILVTQSLRKLKLSDCVGPMIIPFKLNQATGDLPPTYAINEKDL